jgi:drug/metabolite transporter (DMT)-like permease
MSVPRKLTGIVAGLAAGALWGMGFVAPRVIPGFTAVDFTVGRFIVYGIMSLLLLVLAQGAVRPTGRQAMTAVGMSFLGFTGYYLLLVLAIRDAGTEVPSLIIGTIPIWMMLLGKPAGLKWAGLLPGLLLTMLGLGLMMNASYGASLDVSAAQGAAFWRGVAFALVSMVLWTAFGLLNAAWLKRHCGISAGTWTNWLGIATGAGSIALWLFAGSDVNTFARQPQWALFAMLCIATGAGSAWLATVLWNVASQRLSASLCGQLIVSETIFALVYSFMWDGHWPSPLQAMACGFFIAGIVASIRAHR